MWEDRDEIFHAGVAFDVFAWADAGTPVTAATWAATRCYVLHRARRRKVVGE
jgi:hypothetical protein